MDKIILKNCEGYIWKSDQRQPAVYKKEECSIELNDSDNPFIVEGQLYCEEAHKSYSIKYVDGKQLVTEYDLSKLPKDSQSIEYIPNRLEGVAKIKFERYWRAKADEFCEGMEVLMPAEYVFKGFEYNDNKKGEQ